MSYDHPAVLGRGAALIDPEDPGEVGGGREAGLKGDYRNAVGTVRQKLAGFFAAQTVVILEQSLAGLFMEYPGQVVLVHIQGAGDLIQRKLVGVVAFEVGDRPVGQRLL